MGQHKNKNNPLIHNQGNKGAIQPREVKLDLWSLPSPRIEYLADTLRIEARNGFVEIYFAQLLPVGVLNAICISMPSSVMRNITEGFRTVRERVNNISQKQPEALAFESLNNSNFRKFFSNLVRGGANEDSMMLDFYRAEVVTTERLAHTQNQQDFSQDQIRVFFAPSLVETFFAQIEAKLA
jgi:hypothetical protein